MNSKKFVLFFAAAGLVAATSAQAQSSSDTASASASATIISAISIEKAIDLNFGGVVPGATAGTVELSTAGARTATGGATLGNVGATAAAGFTVTGDADATYTITLPSSITITDGTNNMTVDAFISNPDGTGVLTSGTQALAVGATLQVGIDQIAGSYTGTFDVTAAYN